MKRCPECRRDYYDDTLLYCLDDGNALLEGPAGDAETALFRGGEVPSEAPTKAESPGLSPPQRSGQLRSFIVAPVLLVLAAIPGVFAYQYFARSTAIQSVAILPFTFETGRPDIEYLSDGMTETLISSVSQLPSLDVKPRSAVFRYKGKDIEPNAIGRELRVEAVLTGRVVQRGQDIALYIELIEVARNKAVWSETYNRRQSDLVSLQSDIARDVSTKLRSTLSGPEEASVTKTYTTNPEAYELYLKGRYHHSLYRGDSYQTAINHYKQAIDKDPNYALAYLGIALAYPGPRSGTWGQAKQCRRLNRPR